MVIIGDLEEQFNNNRVKILFSNKLNWLYVWFVREKERAPKKVRRIHTEVLFYFTRRDYTCAG